MNVTALIADDEPLLREALVRLLASAWPELEIVAQARNGREAIDQFEAHRPNVCFLDVQMPGRTGVEAAQHIGRRAHLVFVTAFDEYAVQAFAQGALDYRLLESPDGGLELLRRNRPLADEMVENLRRDRLQRRPFRSFAVLARHNNSSCYAPHTKVLTGSRRNARSQCKRHLIERFFPQPVAAGM